MGEWSLIGGQPKLDAESFMGKVANFDKMNFKTYFEFLVYEDPKNPKANILRLNQPSWFFPKQVYASAELVKLYKDFATKFIEALNSRQQTAFNKAEIDRMIKLEIDLADVSFLLFLGLILR